MDQVSEIRDKINIVDLISSYMPLKKMGANFKGICPFHGEKTPSFVVSPERQIWHCFGCNRGGDAYTFIMEYEKVEFVEALRILAEKTGVTLQKFSHDSSSEKERIYKLNLLASQFYNFVLTKHKAGEKGLAYVLNRKINEKVIKTFQIGFAPENGRSLTNFLKNKKGYKDKDLIDAGLSITTSRGLRDFFYNRIMFPLIDHRGNIIGFSGRVIDPDVKTSKYINTKETLVFHKGNAFFGLNIARDAIKKENKAIIMEGEFDVISAFQNGIENIVAIKGTALTENQAKLLGRFTSRVALCLDQDSAGIVAMKRSIPILEKTGLITTVIQTPNGKDPDEALKTDPLGFKKAIKKDISIYDALLEWSLKFENPTDLNGKKNIADELLPVINLISNEIIKDHYLKKLSEVLSVSMEVLIKEQERLAKKEIVGKDREIISPVSKKSLPAGRQARQTVLEEYLTAIVVQSLNPTKAIKNLNSLVLEFNWETPSFQKILLLINNLFANRQDLSAGRQDLSEKENFASKNLYEIIPEELRSSMDICFLFPVSEMTLDQSLEEVKKMSQELALILVKNEIKEKTKKLKIAENEKNEQEIEDLERKLSDLTAKLSLVSN